jgi:hypothetical protein
MSRSGWIVFFVIAALLASLLLSLRFCSAPVETRPQPPGDAGGATPMTPPPSPELTRQLQDARARIERLRRAAEPMAAEAAPLREAILADVRTAARSGAWTRRATAETADSRIAQAAALAERLSAHRASINAIKDRIIEAMEQAGASPLASADMLASTTAGRSLLQAEAEVNRGTMILELIRTEAQTISRQPTPGKADAPLPKATALRTSLNEQLRQIGLEPSR